MAYVTTFPGYHFIVADLVACDLGDAFAKDRNE